MISGNGGSNSMFTTQSAYEIPRQIREMIKIIILYLSCHYTAEIFYLIILLMTKSIQLTIAKMMIYRTSQGKLEASKRSSHLFMDMYYFTENRGVQSLEAFARDSNGLGKIHAKVEYPNDSHDYYYITVCMGMYNGKYSRISMAKMFLNDQDQLPTDIDTVYSGIDPCWEYHM
ncbi:hypothetical protein E3Q02_04407 [Wallemia mellicola]|uniref:Uncharacterized protein n=1 Tax=Wallemia mellicola TaxID=1708541 RepID=A0AB38MQD4_9BASI|nr:hypothetical protein E3Q09_04210 [Wallemia mellicola]TIC60135.1 hypothetical protein E3Q02_04407 [Wallemia mellicola]